MCALDLLGNGGLPAALSSHLLLPSPHSLDHPQSVMKEHAIVGFDSKYAARVGHVAGEAAQKSRPEPGS